MNSWSLTNTRISLERPRLLAILNVTPDSFADGGRFAGVEAAAHGAEALAAQGADAIDIGGESTRPGSESVPVGEQIARVVPVIARLRARGFVAPITVDTTLAPVARAALDAGANGVNDVSAGRDDPGMLPLVAERGAGLVLMHRLTTPRLDRFSDRYEAPPSYGDVVRDVRTFLEERVSAALDAGVELSRIVLDPGLGFGKSVEQNMELLTRTNELRVRGLPVMSALSRKSFVGRVWLKRESTPDERLEGTLALSAQHLRTGAMIFRVHDVAEHVRALGAAWDQLTR